MSFLENHFVAFMRIVWVIVYCFLLNTLDFISVYQLNTIAVSTCFIFGVYWFSKVVTTAITIVIAKVFSLDVDIEYSTQLKIDNKDI